MIFNELYSYFSRIQPGRFFPYGSEASLLSKKGIKINESCAALKNETEIIKPVFSIFDI